MPGFPKVGPHGAKAMKILLFMENNYEGGLDSFVISLANAWPQGDELRFLCNEGHPGLKRIREETLGKMEVVSHNIPLSWEIYKKMEAGGYPKFTYQILSRLLHYGLLPLQFKRVSKLLNSFEADALLVLNGGYPGGQSCRVANLVWSGSGPNVHVFHSYTQPPEFWQKIPEKWLDQKLERSCSHFVSVSKGCMESLKNRSSFRNTTKLHFIHNGIPQRPEPKVPVDIRSELGLEPETPLAVMLGVYSAYKGHDFLLKVWANVLKRTPKAHFVICGYGYPAEVERVTGLVKTMGLDSSVSLQPFRSDIRDCLSQFSVLLIGSQLFESFGLVAVEAMASKVPVVSTAVGGLKEVIAEGEGGYLFEKDDLAGFSEKVGDLLENANLAKEQGELGLKRFENHFRSETMARGYRELLSSPTLSNSQD